ncbi:FtsK/SpoIIIE domain-containing protein [Arthrobacter sp. LFS091]|uniref:FtsK/SpoIIIE domain-containing protein n=1 Tax=Arthrobacter sp. LFS091 TaxID=3229892 RepID=UPI003A800B69
MPLECTLVRSPGAERNAEPTELSIAVPAGTSGVDVQSLIAEAHGTALLTVQGQELTALTVGIPPLVSGAILVDGPPLQPRSREGGSVPLVLLAHSGPAAGSVFRLRRGRFMIGRGQVDIQIPDSAMSREHAVLEVSGTAVVVSQMEGAAPLYVCGKATRRSPINSESSIRCGNSTFSISSDIGAVSQLSTFAGCSVEEPLDVVHASPTTRRLPLALAAGLPLIAGVALVAVTGTWMYLGFTALSAVSLLVPLLTGRKERKDRLQALSRAVQEDIARRRRCSPSAADIVMAKYRPPLAMGADSQELQYPAGPCQPEKSPTADGEPTSGDGTWVRLGTMMNSTANVRMVPHDPRFRPPAIGTAAVTLDPKIPLVRLRGHQDHVDALLRFVLMQLGSFQGSSQTPIILLGPIRRLPWPARFLSTVTLAASNLTAITALNRHGIPPGRLFVIDDPGGSGTESIASVLTAARRVGWQVIDCSGSAPQLLPTVELGSSGTAGVLRVEGSHQDFIPDLIPVDVFDAFCRFLALETWNKGAGDGDAIPDSCSFTDLHQGGPRRLLRRWADPISQTGLTAVLGQGGVGPMTFDFKIDGPHLLVAGTTGSGKSELLRTLVASIAINHSPDYATFLFIDFKGGSGLGPLASLPHCVGMLTDLAKHHLDRALVSLRAEISRREQALAEAGVSDLSQYHRSDRQPSPIPHLLLVIDEFRMLVDQAPGALQELMRIAAIGRSLGIHLVMATQRPQGALTADIRANVTSSIALRVQSDAESLDIINNKAAASIHVRSPGRAFLARASGDAEEFQTASLDVPSATASSGSGSAYGQVLVKPAAQAILQRAIADAGPDERGGQASAGTTTIASTLPELWQAMGGLHPRSPIADPLPDSIAWNHSLPAPGQAQGEDSTTVSSWRIGPFALVDVPAQQVVEPLIWIPAQHGHLAMIGSTSSGVMTSFRAVAAMLATAHPQPHLYVLDAIGLLEDVAQQQLLGGRAGLHQLSLAARIVKRLAAELDVRRDPLNASRPGTPLVLIVTGWCSWSSALRNGTFGWVEAALHDIVRDGTPLGISVLISGERELVSSRFFAAVPNRAYFPSGSTEEARFHWPRLPEIEDVAGRAVVTGNFIDGHSNVAQFREAPGSGAWPFKDLENSEPPFRIRPLPDTLSAEEFFRCLEEVRQRAVVPAACTTAPLPRASDQFSPDGDARAPLWLGVGGDEAIPVALPLPERGVSAILGGRCSGKSSALAGLRQLNPLAPWVYPDGAGDTGSFWASIADQAEAGALDPNSILLVDDADAMNAEGRHALTALTGRVRGIVLTATTGPALVHHLPLAGDVRSFGTGVVLAPSTPHDGELFGVRLDDVGAARPGRGFVIQGKEVTPYQGALAAL